MSRRQRLTFLGIAAAIAVIAVVVLVVAGGGGSDEQAVAPQATGTPAATPGAGTPTATGGTATPIATPDPGPLLTGAKEQEIDVKQGDTVRFRVKADENEQVHVHGYDIEKEVPAGDTITVSFKATITGIFEIEFHHSGAVLARLKVEP